MATKGRSLKVTVRVWIPDEYGYREESLAEDVVSAIESSMSSDVHVRLLAFGAFKSGRRPDED